MAVNTRNALLDLLTLIDNKLKSDVIVVSLGGTALTILGLKKSSLDIDFIVPGGLNYDEFYKVYDESVKQLKLKPGELPPFTGFDMGLMKITDYFRNSAQFRELALKHIRFYIMSIYDIILSKNFRGLLKDTKDIKVILENKEISKVALAARYTELLRQQDADLRVLFTKKFDDLIKDVGHLLK